MREEKKNMPQLNKGRFIMAAGSVSLFVFCLCSFRCRWTAKLSDNWKKLAVSQRNGRKVDVLIGTNLKGGYKEWIKEKRLQRELSPRQKKLKKKQSLSLSLLCNPVASIFHNISTDRGQYVTSTPFERTSFASHGSPTAVYLSFQLLHMRARHHSHSSQIDCIVALRNPERNLARRHLVQLNEMSLSQCRAGGLAVECRTRRTSVWERFSSV